MTIHADIDTALMEVRDVELEADLNDDTATVDACQIVLDKLLDHRALIPRQR